jgi:hypothetical protein
MAQRARRMDSLATALLYRHQGAVATRNSGKVFRESQAQSDGGEGIIDRNSDCKSATKAFNPVGLAASFGGRLMD